MSGPFVVEAIVLSRINYGEADRIVTVLTKDNGKIGLMVKGARKSGSKLAGAIEPLSISELTIRPGKGDLSSLQSGLLVKHYSGIVADLTKSTVAFDALKRVNFLTEDSELEGFFDIIVGFLEVLSAHSSGVDLSKLYLYLQLLLHTGHGLNFTQDMITHEPLVVTDKFQFDTESGGFISSTKAARFHADHVKLLRFVSAGDISALKSLQVHPRILSESLTLVENFWLRVGLP
jgi:DNA repair protein RecO (recombination protein O)